MSEIDSTLTLLIALEDWLHICRCAVLGSKPANISTASLEKQFSNSQI